MRFSGLDEAALGPRLGPFCAGQIEFTGEKDCSLLTDLYNSLKDSIVSENDGSCRIVVNDSKKMYNRGRGIRNLEHGVGVFLELAGIDFPKNLHDLVSTLCPPEDCKKMSSSPWFEDCSHLFLPLSNIDAGQIKRDSMMVEQNMKSVNIRFLRPRLRFVTAKSFNELIVSHQGKSHAVRSVLHRLLSHDANLHDPAPGRLTIDRQGGRRYYRDWLTDLFTSTPIRAIEEGSIRSSYTVGNLHIDFLVSADSKRLETAIASIFAKYLREAAMFIFNHWWSERVIGIRPTAGYPQDADRFIQNLEEAGQLPRNKDLLIRRL